MKGVNKLLTSILANTKGKSQSRRGNRKKGNRKSKYLSETIEHIPAGYAYDMKDYIRVTNRKGDVLEVEGCEVVSPNLLSISTAGLATAAPAVSNDTIVPWHPFHSGAKRLAIQAQAYNDWRPIYLALEWIPQTGTDTDGSVYIAAIKGPMHEVPVSNATLALQQGAAYGSLYRKHKCVASLGSSLSTNLKPISVETSKDADFGMFYVRSTEATSGLSCGTLRLHYRYHFHTPTFHDRPAAPVNNGVAYVVSAGLTYNTDPIQPGDIVDYNINSSSVYTFSDNWHGPMTISSPVLIVAANIGM